MRRNPLDKEHFLEGVRQKWTLAFIVCMFIILLVDKSTELDPTPYLTFLTILAPVTIGGLTASSWNKERHSMRGEDGI